MKIEDRGGTQVGMRGLPYSHEASTVETTCPELEAIALHEARSAVDASDGDLAMLHVTPDDLARGTDYRVSLAEGILVPAELEESGGDVLCESMFATLEREMLSRRSTEEGQLHLALHRPP